MKDLFLFIKEKSRFIDKTLKKIYYQHKKLKFPKEIMIQTSSYCNGNCQICPYPLVKNLLPQGVMDPKLFRKIIDECTHHSIKKIHLHLMNEPFMDKNILKKAKYIKKKLPKTKIRITTNASLLNKDISNQIIPFIDEIYFHISGVNKKEYNQKMNGLIYERVIKNVKEFIQIKKKHKRNLKIFITHVLYSKEFSKRKIKEIKKFHKRLGAKYKIIPFYNRAGNLKEENKKEKRRKGCWMYNIPLTRLNILYNGNVILCCNDWKRKIILGNLSKETIKEVWNNLKFKRLREEIYSKEKKRDLICNKCY